MSDYERYDEAVRDLAKHGYEVIPDPPVYIVRHRSDRDDVSQARDLDDLVELADLMDWAAHRREPLIERGAPSAG